MYTTVGQCPTGRVLVFSAQTRVRLVMKWLLEYFGLFGLLAVSFVGLAAVLLLVLRML